VKSSLSALVLHWDGGLPKDTPKVVAASDLYQQALASAPEREDARPACLRLSKKLVNNKNATFFRTFFVASWNLFDNCGRSLRVSKEQKRNPFFKREKGNHLGCVLTYLISRPKLLLIWLQVLIFFSFLAVQITENPWGKMQSGFGMHYGLINYVDTKAKCCHVKKFTWKRTMREVFIRVYRQSVS
jgi:hypothetical protein